MKYSMQEAADRRQCPVCKKWFLTTKQRDKHTNTVAYELANIAREAIKKARGEE